MNNRQQVLAELKGYIENIDKETTLLLQNLQWDHKQFLASTAMVSCQYVASHRIPLCSKDAHENKCYLAQHGYSKDDVLLPDPVDPNADTVVKLSKQDIMRIINTAAASNPLFKKGRAGPEPLTAARLQQAYSADERRALHDAVVAAAPACHDLADLALASGRGDTTGARARSRAEVLAELRDMKRRRAKYRVAAKTRNYSHVLRDLIKSQMELYAEAKGIFIKTEYGSKTYISLKKSPEQPTRHGHVTIKRERISPEADHYDEAIRSERGGSVSKNRRTRRERDEREPASKRRRRDDHDYREDSSEIHTYKHSSQHRDKYSSKERRRYEEYQSQRDRHYKVREEVDTFYVRNKHENRQDNTRRSGGSRDSDKYDGSRRKDKHDRNYGNSSKNTSKYDAGSREQNKHDRRDKEDSSANSKYDYRYRKHEDYHKINKDSDKYINYEGNTDVNERAMQKRHS